MRDAATIVDLAVNAEKTNERRAAMLKKRMARKGALKLDALLEARRLEYGIPDGAFRVQASFERIIVYNIPPAEQASAESSIIQMTDKTKERMKDASPRGIIVSAGLEALDSLRTNGMDLGHIVLYTHYVIGTTPVEFIDGKEIKVFIMHAGDITGSEDTAAAIRSGEMEIVWNGEQHVYRRKGEKAKPKVPVVPKRMLNTI